MPASVDRPNQIVESIRGRGTKSPGDRFWSVKMPKNIRRKTNSRLVFALQVVFVVILSVGAFLGVLWGLEGGLIF